MNNRDEKPKSMAEAISGFMKASGMDKEYQIKTILGKWEELMGKPIALRTESLHIKSNTLFIELNSSVMRDELFQHKKRIIEIINKEAGFNLINDIYFK